MAEDEKGPIAQADGASDRPAEETTSLLCSHTICLISTDEKGTLQISLDLPDNMNFTVSADFLALTWISGRIIRFLGQVLETSGKGMLDRRERGGN